jgi:hypothetical protein
MARSQPRDRQMSSTTIVALRGSPQHEGRRFVCPVSTWEFLRDLGQTFGWHPRGATYVTSAKQGTLPATLRHNYQPGGMQDCKQIESDDAIEWASSLGIAKRSSHFSGMIRAHAALVRSTEESLLDMLDEFIDFARTGAFVFALRTEPDKLARPSNDSERGAESHEPVTADEVDVK